MDEQAQEIYADLKDYYASPERYTMQDFEDIFQDRDPFEFLQEGPSGQAPLPICYKLIYDIYCRMSVVGARIGV